MTENEIIAKVRTIMNEAGEDKVLSLLNEDTLKLDEYIQNCISDAVSVIAANSKFVCVNKKSKELSDSELKDLDGGGGYIILPDDYVSLIAFKLKGWGRVVVGATRMGSEMALLQSNKYTMAGRCKPVCVSGYNGQGRVLEFYPMIKTTVSGVEKATSEMFLYEAKYNDGVSVEDGDPIAQAVCYMCASLVYSIFENKTAADEMNRIAVELIPKE